MLRAIAIAAVGLACGGAKQRPAVVAADDLDVEAARPSVLDRVPADTPYLLMFDRPEANPHLEVTLAALQRAVALLGQAPHEQGEEVGSPLTFEEMAAAGLDLREPLVLYGVGLYPVLQVGVADLDKLATALDDALGELGARRDELNGKPRWTAELGGATLVVIAGRQHLAAGLIPTGLVAALSPVIAGDRRPRRSVRRRVRQLSRRHRLAGRIGFVDMTAAARGLFGVQPFAIAGVDIPSAFDVAGGAGIPHRCRRAMVGATRAVPRLIYGLRATRPGGERLAVVIELDRATRDRLAALTAEIPAMDAALITRAQLAATLGVRASGLAELLADGLDGLAGLPDCALEKEVGAARDMLRQLAAATGGISGAALAVTELKDGPDAWDQEGAFAVVLDKPDRFYAALARKLPNFKRGPTTRQLGRDLYVHPGDQVFALAGGLDGPEAVEAIVNREPVRANLASVKLRGAIVERLQRHEPDPELEAAAPELARRLAELITPVQLRAVELELTASPDGIEAVVDLTFLESPRRPAPSRTDRSSGSPPLPNRGLAARARDRQPATAP